MIGHIVDGVPFGWFVASPDGRDVGNVMLIVVVEALIAPESVMPVVVGMQDIASG